MTIQQKKAIAEFRSDGVSYGKIAKEMKMSVNTVKAHCQRYNLGKDVCKHCRKTLVQIPKRKKRKFCSDECRIAWWTKNVDKVQKKAVYKFVCAACSAEFTAYGNNSRKYCSHECYIAARYGGEAVNVE